MSLGQATKPSGRQSTPRVPVGPPRTPGSRLLSPERPPRVGLGGLRGSLHRVPGLFTAPGSPGNGSPRSREAAAGGRGHRRPLPPRRVVPFHNTLFSSPCDPIPGCGTQPPSSRTCPWRPDYSVTIRLRPLFGTVFVNKQLGNERDLPGVLDAHTGVSAAALVCKVQTPVQGRGM